MTRVDELVATFIEKATTPRWPEWQQRERLRRMNGGFHVEPTGASRPVVEPARTPQRAAPLIVQPVIHIQTPTTKSAPPVVHVNVDATPKATRTRVVKTDEDGIATETVTEPV